MPSMPGGSADLAPVGDSNRGLEGVLAAVSSVSSIVGETLTYRGYDVEALAKLSSFVEVTYLLWYGELPTVAQLRRFDEEFRAGRTLPAYVNDVARALPAEANAMGALRTVVSALCLNQSATSDTSQAVNIRQAVTLASSLPTAVAGLYRAQMRQAPIAPDFEQSAASNFLWMLFGTLPSPSQSRALEIALIVHADHELNASTFAARVAASTLADLHSAVVAALATLAGPLHGGAAAAVMQMLQDAGEESDVNSFLDERLRVQARVPGFGHRVYAAGDPRARVLKSLSAQLATDTGNPHWYGLSCALQEAMHRKTGLFPNVDFYAASVYTYIGLPPSLFASLFAWSRTSGWIAHILEQYDNNRLIRPRADYVGAGPRSYIPIHER